MRIEMKNVGVREFRDRATAYLSGTDAVAVSKHGQVIGFYIPIERHEDQARLAVVQLGQAVERVLEETGMSEDDLSRLLDLRRPLQE
jgi:hypothetical protein